MKDQHREHPPQASMLSFVRDVPNLCSLVGLFCAVLAMYYAILGIFPAAMISILWAVFFDWADGYIARRIKGRTENHRAFGMQLDSLIDIVSFSVFPAVLLLSYGEFSPWFLPGAFVIVSVGAIRLSHFNVFGLVNGSTYMGLALDNNIIILSFVFLFDGLLHQDIFKVILYTALLLLSVLNVAPIRTPKLSSRWFYALTGYVLVMTAIYGWRLMV